MPLDFPHITSILVYLNYEEIIKIPFVSKKCQASCLATRLNPWNRKNFGKKQIEKYYSIFPRLEIIKIDKKTAQEIDLKKMPRIKSIELIDLDRHVDCRTFEYFNDEVKNRLTIGIENWKMMYSKSIKRLIVHGYFIRELVKKPLELPLLNYIQIEDVNIEDKKQIRAINKLSEKYNVAIIIEQNLNDKKCHKEMKYIQRFIDKINTKVKIKTIGGGFLETPVIKKEVSRYFWRNDKCILNYCNDSLINQISLSQLKEVGQYNLKDCELLQSFIIDCELDEPTTIILPQQIEKIKVTEEFDTTYTNVIINNWNSLNQIKEIETFGNLNIPISLENKEILKLPRQPRQGEEIFFENLFGSISKWFGNLSLLMILSLILLLPIQISSLQHGLINFFSIAAFIQIIILMGTKAIQKAIQTPSPNIPSFILYTFYSLYAFESSFIYFSQNYYSPRYTYLCIFLFTSLLLSPIIHFINYLKSTQFNWIYTQKVIRYSLRIFNLNILNEPISNSIRFFLIHRPIFYSIHLLPVIPYFFLLLNSYLTSFSVFPIFHLSNMVLLIIPIIHLITNIFN